MLTCTNVFLLSWTISHNVETFIECRTKCLECHALAAGFDWPATNSWVKVTGRRLAVNRIRDMDRPACSSFIYSKCEFFPHSHKMHQHDDQWQPVLLYLAWFTAALGSENDCFYSTAQCCGCSEALTVSYSPGFRCSTTTHINIDP